MHSELISALQKANQEIGSLVSLLSGKDVASIYAALPPGELKNLNGKLARIAACLGQLSLGQPKEPKLQSALGEYLANLESLKTVIVRFQDSLARQRDLLKKDLAHMNSARAWVEAFRATGAA